ncbi:hypothetical protein Y888_13255 [Mixta calida B021323]|nr:hypothetical protein Y888_13255 [Mixta calida B021323]
MIFWFDTKYNAQALRLPFTIRFISRQGSFFRMFFWPLLLIEK